MSMFIVRSNDANTPFIEIELDLEEAHTLENALSKIKILNHGTIPGPFVLERCEFTGFTFSNCTLKNVMFKNCKFKNTVFVNCEMEGVKFRDCSMQGCRFIKNDMKRSFFITTEVVRCLFQDCNFKEAYLNQSFFNDVGFTNVDFDFSWWIKTRFSLVKCRRCYTPGVIADECGYADILVDSYSADLQSIIDQAINN